MAEKDVGQPLMDPNKTSLERAFELARSGEVADLKALRNRLSSEGYDGRQLEGKLLLNQLAEMIKKAAPSSVNPKKLR
jgi:hypothetical protein